MGKDKIKVGNKYQDFHNPQRYFAVVGCTREIIIVEDISHRNLISNRWAINRRDFNNLYSMPDGFIEKERLNEYLSTPEDTIKKGIFQVRKEVVDINFKTHMEESEVIKIFNVEIYRDVCYNLLIEYYRFGFQGEMRIEFFNNTKKECYHYFWELFRRLK